ncbi:30S ribosomal protein S12 methylthiotransferase RimO [Paludisphaera mucosa]|uniref:Ribosomal protein uS12 methylthiotransferase RimO n=1 Tax=Paludisphaera mucosa TaxID=3030827 RepID=A0ABT6F458_9BACT|nr:30S ribosomal protein S12 methylthiotransferase RimO [Paludisphaera mucosa]MDG3002209.1 30S ribosomal protein S12 methylthiotransferase RimO [Paludisphaera mucosa]
MTPERPTDQPDSDVRGTISFVSLGCSKNTVDSERMLGLLAQEGYALVPEGRDSDLVIVNTCGFIDAARKESCGVIEEMLERKRDGRVKGVIVAGCLAERQKDQLLDDFPEVDQVVGVFGREQIVQVSNRILGGLHEQRTLFRPAPIQAQDDRARLRITPRHMAYLKVSEGCDRLCTFCAIPYMRGKHVTKPIEMVVDEARELARDGVRELVLVAQDMTYYGMDLYGEPRLADLLRELDAIEELTWIRILYNYPRHFTDELFDVIAGAKRIIPYLDMPLQHINDRMLKVMNRRHTRAETTAIIDRLRGTIPGLVLRTTFIVGFPGETEAEFQEMADYVAEKKFERLGVFTYSLEPDTPAAKLPNQLPDDVKESRRETIMTIQQPLAEAFNRTLVGRTLDVLIDGRAPGQEGVWIGRSYADAPDVDGVVLIPDPGLQTGDVVPCEILDTQGYDFVARSLALPSRRKRARPRPRRRGSSLTILDGM